MYKYDFALSFAGENRDIAEKIALKLTEKGVRVFYDTLETQKLWGEDLAEKLHHIYNKDSKFCIILISEKYIEKMWTTHERKSALQRQLEQKGGYILPIKIDGSILPGLPDTIAYISIKDFTIDQIVGMAQSKMGIPFNHPTKPESAPKVSISHLTFTKQRLIGRSRELHQLDNNAELGGPSITVVHAWGGQGKTSLVNVWLADQARSGYSYFHQIYGWSFYRQGTSDAIVSADLFITTALTWFGDPEPLHGSPWERGERLAECLRQKPTLLILDGIETLQFPPGKQEGRFKDQAIKVFLRELAAANPGHVVVTSRLPLTDIHDFEGLTVLHMELGPLTIDDGITLLRRLDVKADREELEPIVSYFDGHPLSLALYGRYVGEALGGKLEEAEKARLSSLQGSGNTKFSSVLDSYCSWLEDSPELEALLTISTFVRPPTFEDVWQVLDSTKVPAFGVPITDTHLLRSALTRLSRLGLMGDNQSKDTLHLHPLVKEYFALMGERSSPESCKALHGSIFEYLKIVTDPFPETLEGMAPLYAAVAHGCMAGRESEAFEDVLVSRIFRGDDYYSTGVLGAFGSDLSALANFFEERWTKLSPALAPRQRSLALNTAGFRLRAMGRLTESIQPTTASLVTSRAVQDWSSAAGSARSLSQIALNLGWILDAIARGHESVELAKRSGNIDQQVRSMARLADALHQYGNNDTALETLREAEALQRLLTPQQPRLHLGEGFRLWELLLDQGHAREVLDRVREARSWPKPARTTRLSTALEYLSEGKALAISSLESKGTNEEAIIVLDEAVSELRSLGVQYHIPRGYLARAEVYFVAHKWERMMEDISTAREIALRGEMRLHLIDADLLEAKLHIGRGDGSAAKKLVESLRLSIIKYEYLRRRRDFDELAGAVDVPELDV